MKNFIFSFITTSLLLTACAQKKVSIVDSEKNITQLKKTDKSMQKDTATFANGCFWCTEAIFQQLKGVDTVISGYSGGHVENPTYEQVCNKKTGHAEALRIVFDPKVISFDELLEIFWSTHDPTTLNQQGNDVGPQYRSVVFYHNDFQKDRAEHFKAELEKAKAFDKPIVTAVEPFTNFYAAEDYHQNYFKTNGNQPYCHFVIRPKVEKFEKAFKDKIKH
jgi:peptide-methionine (S)-S-oxide reductase